MLIQNFTFNIILWYLYQNNNINNCSNSSLVQIFFSGRFLQDELERENNSQSLEESEFQLPPSLATTAGSKQGIVNQTLSILVHIMTQLIIIIVMQKRLKRLVVPNAREGGVLTAHLPLTHHNEQKEKEPTDLSVCVT